MKIELSATDVGIVLSVMSRAMGNNPPFPIKPIDDPDIQRDIKRVYNKINKQGKAWINNK